MTVRLISRANGYVHNVDTIRGLSDEPCNLRFLSDRSLYILQNLSELDVTFLARYGTIISSDQYIPVSPGTSDASDVGDAINIIRRDLTDMGCNDIVEAINSLKISINNTSCGCEIGQGADNQEGEEGGSVPDPVGDIVYQEPSPIADRKCKAANAIHQTVEELFVGLAAYNVGGMSTLGLSLVVSLIAGVIATSVTTPIGGLMVAVAGALASFGATLVGVQVFDLDDTLARLTASRSDLVCALYSSTTTSSARDAYEAELLSAGISPAASALIVLLLTNATLNVLFFDTSETAAYWPTYTPPVDCASCVSAQDEWVLIPNGVFFGWETASGVFGSGAIDNDGGEFVLSSEPFTIGPAGRHVIGIVVQGFVDAQAGDVNMLTTPAGTAGGTHTRVSALPAVMSKNGRTAVLAGCVPINQNPSEFGTPLTADNFQLILWHHSAPWTITYRIDARPDVCP